MPYIATTTNVPVSDEAKQRLSSRLGQAIRNIPGKSEAWLMLSVQGDVPMFF